MPDGRKARQIRHFQVLAASAGVAAAFAGGGAWVIASRVESGLEGQARAALDAAGLAASVEFDGRDAVLTGTVSTPEEARRAVIVVTDLPGTRKLQSRLRIQPSAPAPASPGAVQQETTPPPSPAPAKPPRAVPKPVPKPAGQILFGTGAAEIPATSDRYLKAVAQYLAKVPAASVRISGHSDNIGTRPLNQELSAARAAAVARRLVALGVDPKRLHSEGFADTRPVASNRTAPGRAANRRAEIVFEGAS